MWTIFACKVYFIRLMNLRDVMKGRRKILALSQNDLAEMAGVSLATIKDIERGNGNPSLSTVSRIVDVLGMEITYTIKRTVL